MNSNNNNNNNDIVNMSHINFKKDNIISEFTYDDVQFILYYDDDNGIIIVIEMSSYKTDNIEEGVELYRIMNIVLYKDDKGDIRIKYTAYKTHIASIKNLEEAEELLDALVEAYGDKSEEWYEKYFKEKEN